MGYNMNIIPPINASAMALNSSCMIYAWESECVLQVFPFFTSQRLQFAANHRDFLT